MKYILTILVFTFISCHTVKIIPIQSKSSARAIYCLRSFLTGEDAGGTWQVVSEPAGSNIGPLLVGDDPCIQFTTAQCGLYTLRYIVGDACCRDTSIIKPSKCCVTGTSICN